MALYSFEGSGAVARLKDQKVVADTSYFIDIAIPPGDDTTPAIRFHEKARSAGVNFVSSVTVRHELMEFVRFGCLLEALSAFRAAHPPVETKWRMIRTPTQPTDIEDFIDAYSDRIHRQCIMDGETSDVASYFDKDIWAECQAFEKALGITYESPDGVSWDALGQIIKRTCIKVTDCMITNFAIGIQANAIVTLDGEFAAVSDQIDVYMPRSRARHYTDHYDATHD